MMKREDEATSWILQFAQTKSKTNNLLYIWTSTLLTSQRNCTFVQCTLKATDKCSIMFQEAHCMGCTIAFDGQHHCRTTGQNHPHRPCMSRGFCDAS